MSTSTPFTDMLDREIELAEQEIQAFVRDYIGDRVQGLIEGPIIYQRRNVDV